MVISSSSLFWTSILPCVASVSQTTGSPIQEGQDCSVDGPEVPSEVTAMFVSDMCCLSLACCVARSHPKLMSKSHSANSFTQSTQCVTVGIHLCPEAWTQHGWLLHSRILVSELFQQTDTLHFLAVWEVRCFHMIPACFVCWVKLCCLVAYHCGFQELISFLKLLKMWRTTCKVLISVLFHQASLYPACTRRLWCPSSSWTLLCTVSVANSSTVGKSQVVTHQFSNNCFLHSCCVHIHLCCAGPECLFTIMYVCWTIFKFILPFSSMLYSIMPLPYTSISLWWMSVVEAYFTNINQITLQTLL